MISIYEPELVHLRGPRGFYSHFLSALIEYAKARVTAEPRPMPAMVTPRVHESCWVRWRNELVFFDMSDHVQLLDLEALKLCSVYFKANLHRGIASRVLEQARLKEHAVKLVPFLFFSEGLGDFERDIQRRRFWGMDRPKYDVCFIMGVYENLVRDGKLSPFENTDEPMTPSSFHFWIRWHIIQALKQVDISGCYFLTSRSNRALEDGVNIFPNMSRRTFSRRMSDGRITSVCTLPHALFPWKASESFMLGRPILIEQAPLTETPAPFMPIAGEHYLELLPSTEGFNITAPLSDPASYRVLERIPLSRFRERAEWLRGLLVDSSRFEAMGESCRKFAAHAYAKKTVAEYIFSEVENRCR